jgi:hypothetical protein
VDSAQVGIFEQSDKVCFSCFLKSKNGSRLEAKIGFEVLGNLADKTLERSLADEQVSGFLVLADLAKGDGSRAVTVGLLHTTSRGGGLTGSLRFEEGIERENRLESSWSFPSSVDMRLEQGSFPWK